MAAGEKTGGRQKGTPNKATADIRALAQVHAPAVIEMLANLMMSAESEQAKIAAGKELLDRGFGKSVQALQNLDADGNPADANKLKVVVEYLGDPAPARVDTSQPAPRIVGNVDLVG